MTWGSQILPPMAMSGVDSPGFGVMPRLTPRKRGGDLVLDVSVKLQSVECALEKGEVW